MAFHSQEELTVFLFNTIADRAKARIKEELGEDILEFPEMQKEELLSAAEDLTEALWPKFETCLYGDVAGGTCALRATADDPPPMAVQLREAVLKIKELETIIEGYEMDKHAYNS
jgi:hypothetical protein